MYRHIFPSVVSSNFKKQIDCVPLTDTIFFRHNPLEPQLMRFALSIFDDNQLYSSIPLKELMIGSAYEVSTIVALKILFDHMIRRKYEQR
jgi:hypothetical protein